MKNLYKIIIVSPLVFLFFLIVCIDLSFAKSSTQLSAKDILNNVSSKYSLLKSYKDTGIVKTSLYTINFQTYFVRPALFLFKWVQHANVYSPKTLKKELYSKHYAIWSNNTGTYSHYRYKSDSSDGIEKEKDIGMAIAGATGVSNGSAHKVPRLLMNDIGGRLITNLINLELLKDENILGIVWFHIKF